MRTKRFADAMALFDRDPGYAHAHLLNNYPWASLGEATVVDIGGSNGLLAVSIAQAFPKIRCVIQDRAELEAEAIKAIPSEIVDRVSFMAHDFFAYQKERNADVYLFRWIFHDWSDEYALRILRSLIPGLKQGAKIVLQEFVLPEPGTVPNLQERILRLAQS